MATISCKPRGVCSWDFILTDGEQVAHTSVNWMNEEGSIELDGLYLQVRKHGWTSGHWTLEHDGNVIASAQKTSAFSRSFEVEAGDYHLEVAAASTLSREMVVQDEGHVVARLRPLHIFTRRAEFKQFSSSCDFATLAFIFWLVTIIWKRHGNSNG